AVARRDPEAKAVDHLRRGAGTRRRARPPRARAGAPRGRQLRAMDRTAGHGRQRGGSERTWLRLGDPACRRRRMMQGWKMSVPETEPRFSADLPTSGTETQPRAI